MPGGLPAVVNNAVVLTEEGDMKVSDILSRLDDVRQCISLLSDLKEGTMTDGQIEGLADNIEEHLEAYIELLLNKEVK